MSLLGIDVGTTGCKAACFSADGRLLSLAYEEYDIHHPQPGWAEMDPLEVWGKVRATIARAAAGAENDPVVAVSVSSMGEAFVPLGAQGQVLGPSLLNFDARGEEYLPGLAAALPAGRLYELNGNTLGNNYSLTKLMWLRDHRPELYAATRHFLLWSGFVACQLGAEPAIDYSLANRTLLFDLERQDWSGELLAWAGLERGKLPPVVPSGARVGRVSQQAAAELGLPAGIPILAGAHDQNANAVGCGVIHDGQAVYGMGTFVCITPVFSRRLEAGRMLAGGLNTEHHAAPGRYVSFIYNQGGSLVKWFRDTCAAADTTAARAAGREVYDQLFAEMPEGPSGVVALPHFTVTGPPGFLTDSSGVLAGLRLETTRGEILKGIVEGATFYLKECVDGLPEAGIHIEEYRAAGGGSKSERWIQLSADIFGRPFVRPQVTEAGALGAAIIAGVGAGVFSSFEEGVAAMVRLERTFEPDLHMHARYQEPYERYQKLGPLMREYLRSLRAGTD